MDYSGITLDQGGAGTLIINGDNTFRTITNSYRSTGPTTITLNSTTQRITSRWGASGGETAKVLTLLGSVTTPARLVFTGSGVGANAYNLSITGVRAYPTSTSWYAGNNSTNNGSLGWIFENLNITNPSKFMLLFM